MTKEVLKYYKLKNVLLSHIDLAVYLSFLISTEIFLLISDLSKFIKSR